MSDKYWVDAMKEAKQDVKLTLFMGFLFCVIWAFLDISILVFPILGFEVNGDPIIMFFIVLFSGFFLFGMYITLLIGVKERVKRYKKLAYPEQY